VITDGGNHSPYKFLSRNVSSLIWTESDPEDLPDIRRIFFNRIGVYWSHNLAHVYFHSQLTCSWVEGHLLDQPPVTRTFHHV